MKSKFGSKKSGGKKTKVKIFKKTHRDFATFTVGRKHIFLLGLMQKFSKKGNFKELRDCFIAFHIKMQLYLSSICIHQVHTGCCTALYLMVRDNLGH